METKINNKLLTIWFKNEARDFPWRHNPTPYQVWISEMMLQQTLASVVVSYFDRWMTLFPTIEDVANASIETVLKAWEGLGYYSRARFIHEAAQYIVNNHQGQIPQTVQELKKIKGLGDYTVGAILSFAFHQKIPAVDGNVLRVLARFFMIEEDIAKSSTKNKITQLAHESLPNDEPWIFNEALIELGATVCQRKPNCSVCPIRQNCLSYRHGKENVLPIKSTKLVSEKLFRAVSIIQNENYFLVRQGQKGEIMHDLYEFPFFEMDNSSKWSDDIQMKEIKNKFSLSVKKVNQEIPDCKHSFTKYRVNLYPQWFKSSSRQEIKGMDWMTLEELKQYAFSSGHRKIFNYICQLKL